MTEEGEEKAPNLVKTNGILYKVFLKLRDMVLAMEKRDVKIRERDLIVRSLPRKDAELFYSESKDIFSLESMPPFPFR
jgi:hypothetical protein